MVAGIKSVKINNSVIICTLSSVFKIHAGWNFPHLECVLYTGGLGLPTAWAKKNF